MNSLLKNTLKMGCLVALSFTLTSCGKQEEEKEGFQYSFEKQTFVQSVYREVDAETGWFSHSGQRTIRIEPNNYKNSFNYYLEYAGVYCFGETEATYRYVSQKEFALAINTGGTTGGSSSGSGSGNDDDGIYNPHDPYETPEEPVEPDSKADVMDYFMISTITKNTVTAGCNFPIESVQYTHFRLFQNGDLIVKDYNRRLEYWFKPL